MRGFPKNRLYEDLATGELLTYSQMIDRAENEYGFDEFSYASELWEYFDLTEFAT